MFEIILYEPEIPPNAGNIMRLAANTGCRLHLVDPLGFRLTERAFRRAGLDYGEASRLVRHADWAACTSYFRGRRIIGFSTRARRLYTEMRYAPGDVLLFGPETRGLPDDILLAIPAEARVRLPMRTGSRSLNLSNAVAVAAYEAWRQQDFAGGA